MTTEHYNLETGRATTISDANGRASIFLGTVSTSLVELAFVGQISRSATGLGQAFYVFGLVLFPSLVFLGLVTFARDQSHPPPVSRACAGDAAVLHSGGA
jgi:hypothetical protein